MIDAGITLLKLLYAPMLNKLQALCGRLDKRLIVRSGYRNSEHNRAVGGAGRSKHMNGTAFDIAMANHDSEVGQGPYPPVVEYSRAK